MDTRVAHALLAAINDSPDSVVLMLDSAARAVYANPAARSFLGLPEQGLLGRIDWSAVVAPGQHGLMTEAVSRLLTGEDGLECDLQVLPVGSHAPRRVRVRVRRAQAAPHEDPLWLCWGSLNAFREQLEERLRQTTERLEQTLDSGSILVFGHDRDLRVTWVRNPASGRSAQSLLGLTDRDLLDDPQESERLMAVKRSVIETGEPVRFQQALTFGGARRHYDYQLFPERDAQGVISGVLGIAFDVTDRYQAEVALLAEQERKDEFIALLAHELRSPLAPLRNLLTLLRDAAQPGHDPAHLAIMDRQVRYMVRLIDDLLDLSRINRDQLNLRYAPFDLALLLQRLGEPVRHDATDRRIARLETDLPGVPVPFFGDADRIAQIIANLLENARKFTPSDGLIRLGLESDEREVRVSVRDTGIGIAPEHLERVFERFVRVRQGHDLSGARDAWPGEGLGLGLYLSKRLATMHGGVLTARSAGAGQGCLFTLTLPHVPSPGGDQPVLLQSASPPAAPTVADRTLRILVVDDHQDACDSLVLLLQAWGYQVQSGRDGLEGLQRARTFRPHVVILDIAMPRMDGFELAQRLRAEPLEHPLRVLALTGFGDAPRRDQALRAGIDVYLVKPAEPRQLGALLAEWSRDVQRL